MENKLSLFLCTADRQLMLQLNIKSLQSLHRNTVWTSGSSVSVKPPSGVGSTTAERT